MDSSILKLTRSFNSAAAPVKVKATFSEFYTFLDQEAILRAKDSVLPEPAHATILRWPPCGWWPELVVRWREKCHWTVKLMNKACHCATKDFEWAIWLVHNASFVRKYMSKSENYTREVDWLKLVRFHKDIGRPWFLFKKTTDDKSENWSFILNFEPSTMADSWKMNKDVVLSSYFLMVSYQINMKLICGRTFFRTVSKNDRTNGGRNHGIRFFIGRFSAYWWWGWVLPWFCQMESSPSFFRKWEAWTDWPKHWSTQEDVIEEAAKNNANSNMVWSQAIISAFSRKVRS